MPRSDRTDPPRGSVVGIPWLTSNGLLDPAKFPMEGLLPQALDSDFGSFRTACTMLSTICRAGRAEAGVYLLGLLRFYHGDLERLDVVAEYLGAFPIRECAEALFAEIRRVKSSNKTRRYIASVLRTLSRFPAPLLQQGIQALADDTSFSAKMSRRFRDFLD
jgi:hypothetical protein